jgi:hypothetical protein
MKYRTLQLETEEAVGADIKINVREVDYEDRRWLFWLRTVSSSGL